jgi:hypothetical protein
MKSSTLSLVISTYRAGVWSNVTAATDDTYRPDATSGDVAMSTALAGLAGESLSCWDLSRSMLDALASLAIDWPTTTADVYADDECPATLRSSGVIRAAREVA